MMFPLLQTVAAALLGSAAPVGGDVACQPVVGKYGNSSAYGSGWIDLASPVDVRRGDTLQLAIGGSATRIIVRLLPKGEPAPEPIGIVGEFRVGQGGGVTVVVPRAAPLTSQVSVHGLRRPWNLYDLGASNGPAVLLSVERCSGARPPGR